MEIGYRLDAETCLPGSFSIRTPIHELGFSIDLIVRVPVGVLSDIEVCASSKVFVGNGADLSYKVIFGSSGLVTKACFPYLAVLFGGVLSS